MEKDNRKDQSGGVPHKKDKNAGSGGFNQGSEQDPHYDEETPVSGEEKRTGNPPVPGKQKDKPKDGRR